MEGPNAACTVVILPIDMEAATNTYYLDHLHKVGCLYKTTVKTRDPQIKKQVAFCPYCGIMSENNESHLNHVRWHTRMEFLCGGCLSVHSPFLTLKGSGGMSRHLKNCESLKECRDQKRQRYDQAKQASALTRMTEEMEEGNGNEEDDDDTDDGEEEEEDNDDARDEDYQP